jgi:hypothetical protein
LLPILGLRLELWVDSEGVPQATFGILHDGILHDGILHDGILHDGSGTVTVCPAQRDVRLRRIIKGHTSFDSWGA